MKVTKKMKRFAALLIAAVVMLSGVPLPSVQAAGDAKGVDVLTFTVKDEEGHPVEGVELDIYDRGGRTYTNLKSKMGGVVRWNIPSHFDMYNGQVLEIKPINEEEEIGSITFKVKFDGFYTVIDTINGEPAENVKNLELTVNKKGGTVEDKPEITSVSLNKSSLENAGGVVQFSVKGKKLKDKVEVEVLKNGVAAGEVKIQQMENQETWNEYWITLPKNEAETEVQYTLRAKLVGDPATVKEKTVTVKGTGLVANPEITQVSVNKTSLESAGGVVQFSVKGKKLKDKVEVEVLKNGVAAGEVKIQQMENQETWNEYWITLPKNEETTAIEYTLRAKVTGDEASAKEAKVTVKAAEVKSEIAQVSVNKTSLESTGGVVQFSVKGKKLKDKIEVEVLKNGVAAGEVKIQQMENQETWNEYWITLPKNEETTAIEYTLRAKVTGDEASAKEAKVTVKAAEVKSEIAQVSVNKTSLESTGGVVQFSVKGKKLKDKIEVEVLKNGVAAGEVKIQQMENQETWNEYWITLPKNEETTAIEYTLRAKVTGDEASAKEAKVTVKEAEKPEVNKEALKQKITDAKAIENENYTEASWNALQAAIAAAEAVRDDADATQDAVDAQVTALKKAVDGLKENSEKPNPEKPNTEKPNTNKPNPNKPNTNKPNANKPNVDKNENAAPKTGDSAPFVPCMAGMICAAAVAGMVLKKRKSFE